MTTLTRVRVIVLGKPAPQGSKKIVPGKAKGRGRLVEQSKDLPAWREAIMRAARAQSGLHGTLDGPLFCQAVFVLAKPPSTKYPDQPEGPPDTDKLQRALGDGLQAGGLIADDARIVHWDARKRWAGPEEPTGAIAYLSPYRSRA